jgi:GMP synthase-like glutamine amidotransferase
MLFAVIDNNREPMNPSAGRGGGFARALSAWKFGEDYEFIRYSGLAARRRELENCRGLILSGSAFDFALPDGSLDRGLYETMSPQFELMHAFRGPILGICFGHQLMAMADEFEPGRNAFGGLRVRDMARSSEKLAVLRIHLASPLRFSNQSELWVQFSHKQEVVLNDVLAGYFDILAGSNFCPVYVLQHRTREWFGVQFHPEIGLPSKSGALDRHREAIRDGKSVLDRFVRYCLR